MPCSAAHLIERGLVGLYRWYLARSQAQRDWNPDRSFNWRALRPDHSPQLSTIVEGFFAIEHYIPDYISKTVAQVRQSYGRSHFQISWGAEEEKHADLWQNTLLFSRFRTPQWIENYKQLLQTNEWQLPWEDALHMTCYVVLQERVTQMSYLNTALIARGENDLHARVVGAVERMLFDRVLRATGGHLGRTAERLGLRQSTVSQHIPDSELRGRLRFGASADFVTSLLPEVLREFVRTHPLVEFELTVAAVCHDQRGGCG